ncbi:transposase [Symbiopectobacterium purcellii]|uniref:transposase n=1 Tax=Symbiopectobacterium purcellii TaxID=2871826 RepID=UPI003F8442EE
MLPKEDVNQTVKLFNKAIQQVIIDAGYMVEYLPTYSPDLNPIEHKWAQAKSKKREMGCDTESLFSVHMV